MRCLAHATGGAARVGDIAKLHRVAPERVLAAIDELVSADCAVAPSPWENGSGRARLTLDGARLAQSDPIGPAARCAQQALDKEALWGLVQLGGALLRA